MPEDIKVTTWSHLHPCFLFFLNHSHVRAEAVDKVAVFQHLDSSTDKEQSLNIVTLSKLQVISNERAQSISATTPQLFLYSFDNHLSVSLQVQSLYFPGKKKSYCGEKFIL